MTSATPLADADTAVVAWLARAGVGATLGPPTGDKYAGEEDADGGGVRLWPLALLPDQAWRTTGHPDGIRLRIRYLITPTGWESAVLDRLLVAVVAETTIQLVGEPVPAETWQALGVRPRAAVQVELPIHVMRPVPVIPVVRARLRVDHAPVAVLRGRVLGPGAVPVPGARVQVIGAEASTTSDSHGAFTLPGLPSGPVRLLVTGKGLRLATEVEASAQPVDLLCDFEEV
jgi:hypothetical protein